MSPISLPSKGLHNTSRSLRGACFSFLTCVLLYAQTGLLYAEPYPSWPKTALISQSEVPLDQEIRYTFILPKRHPFCLVQIPSQYPEGGYPTQFAVRFSDKWLPFRLVHAATNQTSLLVDATQALGGDTIEIYPIGRTDIPLPDSPRPSTDTQSPDFWIPHAPQPISCEFRPSRFTTDPLPPEVLTSPQIGIFRRNGPQRFMARNFEGVSAHIRNLRHERRGTAFCDGLTDLYTWVYIDQPGTYLFAIQSRGATSLALGLDEHLIAQTYTPNPKNRYVQPEPPAWALGSEITLEPGIYRLHAANYYLYTPGLSIGWLRPGATEISDIKPTDLLSGQPTLPSIRVEHRDDTLVTRFRTYLSKPYSFLGTTNVFIACTATPRCDLWVSKPDTTEPEQPTHAWSINGTSIGTTEGAKTFILPLGRHEIGLTTSLYDATATASQVVYTAGIPQQEYRVSATLNGIAPLLRNDDILRPDLWVTGDFAPPISVEAILRVQLTDGTLHAWTNALTLVQNWARLEGTPFPVKDVASLSWSLSHGTISLASDTLILQRPPFRTAPTSISGSTLRLSPFSAVSYVLPQTKDPIPTRASATTTHANLILIDDILLPPAASTNTLAAFRAAFGPETLHLPPSELRRDHGEALAGAAFLCGLDAIAPHSTVILSLGSEAIYRSLPPETYERELLALALLLRDARAAHVIIATPQPYLSHSSSPHDVRPYAAAALHAAALGGFPTADLFSSFQNARDNTGPLVSDSRLTPEGMQRAAQTIFRHLP